MRFCRDAPRSQPLRKGCRKPRKSPKPDNRSIDGSNYREPAGCAGSLPCRSGRRRVSKSELAGRAVPALVRLRKAMAAGDREQAAAQARGLLVEWEEI